MKKISLLLLMTALTVISFSQSFPTRPTNGSVSTMNTDYGARYFGRGIVICNFSDTTAANNVTYMKNEPYIIITLSDHSFWRRNSTATQWIKMSGVGGSSVTSYSKNLSGDSTVLLLSDGTRYAAKDNDLAGVTTNILNDTTLIICSNGTNLCDTSYITNVGSLQTVTILNSSSIEVCGSLGCDTLSMPAISGTGPAGLDTEVQFNNAGVFGASSSFKYIGGYLYTPQIIAVGGGNSSILNLFSNAVGPNNGTDLGINGSVYSTWGSAFSTGTNSTYWHKYIGNIANTGGTNVVRGIWYAVTEGVMTGTDHRAIETQTGNVLLGTTSGSTGIGANTSIATSAILDVTSTAKGALLPRMTTAQRNAISSPDTSLIIYNKTTKLYSYNNGTDWVSLQTIRPVSTLTDGATITWNLASVSQNADVTISGDRTLVISNPVAGMYGRLKIIQDVTGGWEMIWPATFEWITGAAPTLSTTPGAKDIVTWFYNGTTFEVNCGLNYKVP